MAATQTPINEAFQDGGFLVSEANGHRSRDKITLTGSAKVLAGTVLGKQTTGASAVAAALGTNTGNGVFGAVTLVTVPTQIGVYTLTFTAATTFNVVAPNGASATGSTGVAFSALGIGFTITAGGTAFVAGDTFAITTVAALGKPTATAAAGGSNTGNGTSSAVTTTGYAPKLGVYDVSFVEPATNLGTFLVTDPAGQEVGHGVVGTAFNGGGLSFTIADGSTDFVSGDQFSVTVSAGAGKWLTSVATAVDGSQTPAGILFGTTDAILADKSAAAVVRSCEVNASELIWDSSYTAAAITAGLATLATLGIIAR